MMRIVGAAARLMSHVAAIALLGMVAVNVLDVGLRSTINSPIFGAYEIVELLLAAVAFLVIPEAFLREGHITVELVDQIAGPRIVAWLKALGMLATVVFLALLTWAMIQPALDMITFNDVTFNLHMPKIWDGAFVLAGIGGAAIAALVMFVRSVAAALREGRGP